MQGTDAEPERPLRAAPVVAPAAPRARWWVPLAVGVATGLLAWFRLSPTTRATLWAEDGRNFLGDRLREGPAGSWFESYAGYLHVVPRLLADAVVSFVPVDAYAVGMTVLSCAVVGLVGAVLVWCTRDLVPWLPARVALGLATALLPAMPVEVLGNAANLHWALLWLAPWLLLAAPRSHREGIALGAVGLVAALTEIQLAWFLPLALHRFGDARRWWVRGGVLLGLAAQGATTLAWPREDAAGGDQDVATVATGFVVNALTSAWTASTDLIGRVVEDDGVLPLALTALPAVLAVLYVLLWGNAGQRWAAAGLALGAAVVWSAAVVLNPWTELGYPEYRAELWDRFSLIRYGVVPALFLVAAVVLAAAVHWSDGRRVTPVALLAGLAVVAGLSFDVPRSERDDGPRWDDEVTLARDRCRARDPDDLVELPIAPEFPPDEWNVTVRCDQLGRP